MKDVLDIPRTAIEVFNMLPEGTLCEVIDNVLYMSPSPTTDHQRLLLKISAQISLLSNKSLSGEVFIAPCDVYLDEGENVVQPDILYIKADRSSIIEKKGIIGAPDLVIEILSTNISLDKEMKLNLYQRNRIPEYLIVDPETKRVWHYLLIEDIYILQPILQSGILNIKQLSLQIDF